MKSLLVLLLSLKYGKLLLSGGTIILSVFSYALFYGWPFAAGFVGLIFVHEMGHYLAAKRRGLNVGLPTFIPFVGAWIELKEQPMNAETEAYVAFAGPLVGTLGAFALYFLARQTGDNQLLLALAQSGFILNLFNLIPLSPLDGGRITSIISPKLWFFGVPILIAAWIYSPSSILILIAIFAIPQLIKAWKMDSKSPEYQAYYNAPLVVRVEYAALYLTLAIVLALMAEKMHVMIHR